MRTKNYVDVIGFVSSDPELQHTAGGVVARFSVATTERWKDKDDRPQQRTEWHRIAFWGPRAEVVAGQIANGALVEVEGALRSSTWEKDGVKRTSWEIVGREYRLLGRPAANDDASDEEESEDASPALPI